MGYENLNKHNVETEGTNLVSGSSDQEMVGGRTERNGQNFSIVSLDFELRLSRRAGIPSEIGLVQSCGATKGRRTA